MKLRIALLIVLLPALAGCSVLPEISHQPTLHNPFPQLSKVAVAPFFNLSDEPTLDGRQFAEAYFNELQLVPGFEVVPVGVVEQAMLRHQIQFAGASAPDEARRLAEVLGVDAVVIGAVTDYSPYYPPRCAMQVEWYAANPCFHPIPAGYGLPWGTPDEADIPGPLLFETEFALAKEQLATQTPGYEYTVLTPAGPMPNQPKATGTDDGPAGQMGPPAAAPHMNTQRDVWIEESSHEVPTPGETSSEVPAAGGELGFPPNWPDPNGLIPPPPRTAPQECCPTKEPVLRHTQAYNGHDTDFTEALAGYYYFRDDARFGGWQSYLERSDDFIRFCCHMHIWELLSARGGAGETRVVWRWPEFR